MRLAFCFLLWIKPRCLPRRRGETGASRNLCRTVAIEVKKRAAMSFSPCPTRANWMPRSTRCTFSASESHSPMGIASSIYFPVRSKLATRTRRIFHR